MIELVNALGEVGAPIATVIILAYVVLQQNKMIKGFQKSIDQNTEALNGLKDLLKSKK